MEEFWLALIVERTDAAARRAREKLGPMDDAFQFLTNEIRDDPLTSEGVARALRGDAFETTVLAEAGNEIRQVELWVKAMQVNGRC